MPDAAERPDRRNMWAVATLDPAPVDTPAGRREAQKRAHAAALPLLDGRERVWAGGAVTPGDNSRWQVFIARDRGPA